MSISAYLRVRSAMAAVLGLLALIVLYLAPAAADRAAEAPERVVPAGQVLGHSVLGTGPEKIIVLHSWMGTGKTFDPAKLYLDQKAFTFAFADVRGYGKSINMTGAYTAREIASDVFRLADQLGWRRFHLLGHSMNGQAVQRMALDDWKRGDLRIKSVIATTPVSADGYPADEGTRKFLWAVIGNRAVTEQAFGALTGKRMHRAVTGLLADRHLATSKPDAMKGYYKMWLDTDFSAELAAAGVKVPFLVIGGRQDLPGFQEDHLRRTFGAWLKNVEFAFITDAGHFPMRETPAYFASLVQIFLEKHSGAGN